MALFNFGKKKKTKEGTDTKEQTETIAAKEEKTTGPEQAEGSVDPKNIEDKKTTPTKTSAKKQRDKHSAPVTEDISRILLRPRITEKATSGIEKGVYVFDVAPNSNKKQIFQAIKQVYNVEPKKVHITKIVSKNVKNIRTGISGVKPGGKKAYVYLKSGESISIL